MIAAALAVVVSGLAIFIAPGAVVLAAGRTNLPRNERFSFEFATSLSLLAAAFALCLLLGRSLEAAPFTLAIVTIAAAGAARVLTANDLLTTSPRSNAPALSRLVLALLTLTAVVLAVAFAPVGSVDRWWYLAYVRAWLDAPVLTLVEPFLGTGKEYTRFGVHPWLFGLAAWSRMSGVDPVAVYERAAPALVVLASVSAARTFAVELFGDGRRARLCVLASILLWSGSIVPVLARAGEDKVLAASALVPLCVAAFLRVLRGKATNGNWMLLGFATIATATVHALAYAFALLVLLPMAAVLAWRRKSMRQSLFAATALFLFVAIVPAVSGISVHRRLHAIGAELVARDHPVVRVHQARERLLEFPSAGYVVSPRLLMHPVVLLAFAGVIMLIRRRDAGEAAAEVRSERRISGPRRAYLAVALCVPLAFAFVPPLPVLAGLFIPPWMVYRILWLLPLAPLAAIAAGRIGRNESSAMVLLMMLGVPVLVLGSRDRLDDVRERLAAPQTEDFRELVEAVRALPVDALVVAAPELAERLPALTARHIVAGLDRSTVVFSASRDLGEARLRARAALLAGDNDAFELAALARVRPTHAIFDPRSNDQPRCSGTLHAAETAALCTLAPDVRSSAPSAIVMEQVPEAPRRLLLDGECEPPQGNRRDPWSASVPITRCQVPMPFELQARDNLLLLIEASTGRGADELRIRIDGIGTSAIASVRVSESAGIALRLPPITSDVLRVRIASAFLPFVHPLRVAVATR